MVTGVVSDPSGAVVAHATVHVEGRVSLAEPIADTTSDETGRFALQLVPGTYKLFVTAPGFEPFVRDAFVVGNKGPKPLAVTLHVESANETVTVSGDENSTSEENNGSAIVFKGKQLDTLSENDSTLQQQLNAIAGSDGPNSAHLYVDGFSGGRFPPKSSIREIRINQNPFSAQYDDFGLGRIEIFTKPGSDALHGFFRLNGNSSSFNAPNPFERNQPAYHTLFFDGNVSGPLGKKTSVFLGSNYYDQAGNATVNATSIDPATLATVPLIAAVPAPSTNHGYSGRLDRQFNANNTFTARYEYNEAFTTNGGVGQLTLASEGYNSTAVTQTLQLGNTQVIGAHRTNETRFQYIRTRTRQDAVSTDPTLVVEGSFNGGGSPTQNFTDNQDRYEFQDYFGWDHGKHFVRLGARYRLNRDANVSRANYNGQYTFTNLTSYGLTLQGLAKGLSPEAIRAMGGGASQFTITVGQPSATFLTGDIGIYAEDEWKARKNVTVDAGMRFESQSGVYDHSDPAPRVGLSWAVHQGDDKHPAWFVLRTGAGMFYDRIDPGSLLTTVRQNGISQVSYILDKPDAYPALPDLSTQPSVQPTTYRLDPRERSPYAIIATVGIDRSLGKLGNISFNYYTSRGVHQLVSINANAPLPGTYDPSIPGSGVRPFGASNIDQFTTEAVFRGNKFNTHWNLQPAKWISMWGFYGFSYTNADSAGASSSASNSYNIGADYGQSVNNIHNRLFTGAELTLPFHVTLEPFLAATGGHPFNITTGEDNNGDTIYNDRPAFATDLTRSSVYRTPYGNFDANPLPSQRIVPYNYVHGPAFASLQLALNKSFQFGPRPPLPPDAPAPKPGRNGKVPRPDPRYELSFFAEAQNLFNHTNGGTPIGVLTSPSFGHFIDINNTFSSNTAANRSVDVGTWFRF